VDIQREAAKDQVEETGALHKSGNLKIVAQTLSLPKKDNAQRKRKTTTPIMKMFHIIFVVYFTRLFQ
jgi:hypothetical protein